MDKDNAIWVCPLYQGDHGSGAWYGCTEHGKAHNTHRYITYSFHGGLRQYNDGANVYNPGDRRKLGQPYIIELGDGRRYQSNILFSDTAAGDNGWVPVLYPVGPSGLWDSAPWPAIVTNHSPPPGRRYKRTLHDLARILAIDGSTMTNWTFDDGSAQTRWADPATALNSGDWTAVPSQRRYMLFPN